MPESPPSRDRDVSPDLVRAVGVLLVTLFHAWRRLDRPTALFGPINWFEPISEGAIGVAMFVFLSGYCLHCYSQLVPGLKGGVHFWVGRMLRLSGPYYMALLFWIYLINNRIYTVAPRVGTWDIVSHFLFLHTFDPRTYVSISAVFWYLGLLAQLYLLYPLLAAVDRRCPHAGRWLLLALTVAFAVWANLAMNLRWFPRRYNYFLHSGALIFLLPLWLGVFFAQWTTRRPPFPLRHHLGWGLVTLPFVLFWLFLDRRLLPFTEIELHLRGVALAAWILWMAPLWQALPPLLLAAPVVLGHASYSIYLYNFVMYLFTRPGAAIRHQLLTLTLFACIFGVGMHHLIAVPWDRIASRILRPLTERNRSKPGA